VSGTWQYYIATLLVYTGVNVIACWALNLQFGVAGVLNFAFIMYQAIGAYTAAVVTLGPSGPASFQHYVVGWSLPWPLSLLLAALIGGVLSLLVGLFALRPSRRDYQAMVMLVASIIASTLVISETGWLNGAYGLAGIPHPFQNSLGLGLVEYGWFYVGLVGAVALIVLAFVSQLTRSPWGRRLRAMRDNASALRALGGDVRAESLKVYVIGGALAALSGAILAQFIGAWSPNSWETAETFLYFTALIVGGAGNNFGAFFGAALVLGIFQEAVRYLPAVGYATVSEAVQFAALGVLILAFLWFRPQGLFPERRRRYGPGPRPASHELSATAGQLVVRERPGAGAGAGAADVAEIEVRDLTLAFRGVHAVDGASFAIPRGRITGLIGPNGAGKSTTLKLIAGALAPASGHVLHAGADVGRLAEHERARRGIIRTFQLSSEFASLTVLENLLVAAPNQPGATFRGALLVGVRPSAAESAALARAHAFLDRFGLADKADEPAGRLSGGQKRLVEITRALMAEPAVLLLDEPLAGVNPTLRLRIEEHLTALGDEGLTMVLVEHELATVERLCDSVIVMAQGRTLASGTMAELRANTDVVEAYLVG
jgi:branched-chain amino acid transport system permease protein